MGVDGSMVPAFGRGTVAFIVTTLLLAGLGIWKVVEILIWLFSHIQIS